jgi:hypothetical protein
MEIREITDQTFLGDFAKFKSEKAKAALVKNKAWGFTRNINDLDCSSSAGILIQRSSEIN